MKLRFRPVGDSAVSAELEPEPVEVAAGARAVRALHRVLAERPFPGLVESVPALRALLVIYDPRQTGYDEVCEQLARLPDEAPGTLEPARRHELRVRYGGDDGPDLPEVAARLGLSEADVIARHASVEYVALMLGFMPGFAYLGPLPPELELPRRATPRTRLPAGSVAIAGRQTAVYPSSSPGGWHVIGRTDARLFDPRADPPALILPGDIVAFVFEPGVLWSHPPDPPAAPPE